MHLNKFLLFFFFLPGIYFTQCNDPSGMYSVNVGWYFGTVRWSPGGNETSWEVSLGPQGFSPGTAYQVITSSTFQGTPYCYFTGLAQSTTYDVYVRALCGSGLVSNWDGPFNLTTQTKQNHYLNWTGSTTYVTDQNFEHFLETHDANGNEVPVGDPSSMGDGTDGNNSVTTANIINVTTLNLDSLNIMNFGGIEDFINLEHLSCRYNYFGGSSEYTISLSNNTSLKTLDCSQNGFRFIDLSKNTALTELNISNINFPMYSSIDSLSYLDLSQNTSLINLNCSGNKIHNLNLAQNNSLEKLICISNKLTNIDVSNCVSLRVLNCAANPLTSLDISNNTQLKEITIGANGDQGSIDGINYSSGDAWGNGGNINTLDVTNNTQLEIIRISYHPIKNIDLSQNINLKAFQADYCELESLDVSNNPNLVTLIAHLDTSSTMSSFDLTQNVNIKLLGLTQFPISNIDISNLINLERLFLYSLLIDSLDLSQNSLINAVGIRSNPNLLSLDFRNNPNLVSAFIKENNKLNHLDLRNVDYLNFIHTAELNGNPDLSCVSVDDTAWANVNWHLYLQQGAVFSNDCDALVSSNSGPKTYIPDDNFEAFLEANGMGDGVANNDSVFTANISNVTTLNLDSQNISLLTGLEDFTNLAVLSCRYNSLTSLDISQNTNLYKLNCRYNQISALDVTQNTALKMLNCNDNSLTALDVSQNTALINLGLEDNQLTSLDVSNNSALKYFICGDNQLTSLDVSNNTALEYLAFHANQINSIDVSNNVALKVLSFGKNQLTTIDVSNNTQLNVFRCYENQITSLNLSANSNLHTIDCSYNPLTCLNLKNGNNSNITDFDATRNSSLNCIEVDDVNWATTHLSVSNNNIDSAVTFSTNCSYPGGCASNQSGGSGGTGSYPPGSVFCNGTPTAVVDVTNPVTGKTWMDRNLGASRAATSSTDTLAYGDLYQWGRAADGHQCRNSNTTTTLSSTDQPGHGDFINSFGLGQDWQSPQNDNLWQGVNGINNPCPSGYRIPTEAEWEEEYLSWITSDAAGAMSSPLKLPRTGYRTSGFYQIGWMGQYWTSTTSSQFSRLINFVNNVNIQDGIRNSGNAVRCIKDY